MDANVSQQLLNLVLAIGGLLAACATYGVTKLGIKAKAETQKISDDSLRQKLNDALDDTEDLTIKTVGSIEQETAKDLRQAVKDGKIDRSELVALSQKAVDTIKSQLEPEALQLLQDHFADFDAYLLNAVKNRVLKIKSTEA